MLAGVLEVRMQADLTRLVSDMDKAKRTVRGTVSTINNVLGAIGVGISFAFIGSLIKETTKLNQRYQELGVSLTVVGRNVGIQRAELDKTSASLQKMGISMIESRQTVLKLASSHIDLAKAEELADLARNAAVVGGTNTSQALERIVHGIRSAEVEVLKTIGITVSFEQAYKDLSAELGKNTAQLTLAEKQQARLNTVLAQAPELAGQYTAAMNNAGKQMRSTERLVEDLKVRIGGLFDITARNLVGAYTGLLNDLDGQIDTLTSSGEFERWGDNIARTLAFMGDGARSVIAIFNIVGKTIGAAAAQAAAVAKLDFAGANKIQTFLEKDIEAEIASMSRLSDSVEGQIVQRKLLSDSVTGVSNSIKQKTITEEKSIQTVGKSVNKSQDFIKSLRQEIEVLGKTEFELKRMEAAKLGVADAAKPLIDQLEIENGLMAAQRAEAQALADDWKKIEQVTESVKTEEEKLIDTQNELNRLLDAGLGIESYTRAMKKAEDGVRSFSRESKKSFKEVDQFGIQAARNLQSAFADGLFNFFDDGLKGMVKSVATAVKRMIAEFAALKIAQNIGLGSILGLGSSAAFAGGGGLLSGLGNAASSGFGLQALVGNGLSGLGSFTGSAGLTQFGAGFSGDAISAFAGPSASLGASFGTAAAGLGAGAVGVGIGGLLAGDKKVLGLSGTTTSTIGAALGLAAGGPIGAAIGGVIGGGINKLFGHGPLEFRQQSLQGGISADGFDGDITNVFRAKGGVFSSNKHKERSAEIPEELQSLLDGTLRGFFESTKAFSKNMGLSASFLDTFSKEIQIKSEKNEQLTEEAIGAMLTGIGEEIAAGILPTIETFRKAGETQFTALARLSDEFSTLSNVFNVLGVSLEGSRQATLDLSIAQRSAIVEISGGIEALNTKVGFFADNFLTDQEKFDLASAKLNKAVADLGLSADTTEEQYIAMVKSSVQAGGASVEFTNQLLALGPSIMQVKEAASKLTPEFVEIAEALEVVDFSVIARTLSDRIKADSQEAFDVLARSVGAEQIRITDTFNTAMQATELRINNVTDSISRLKSLSDALKNTVDTIYPTSLETARATITAAIASASRGNVVDLESVRGSLSALSDGNTNSFSSLQEFQISQAKNASLLDSLGRATDSQLSIEEKNLVELQSHKKSLEDGFALEQARLDSILSNAQLQLDALNNINTSILSVDKASGNFNSVVSGASQIVGGNIVNAPGKKSASNAEIAKFTKDNANDPFQIYAKALEYGVSSTTLAANSQFSKQQIDQFVKENNLAKFDTGGIVPKTGLAMVHANEKILNKGQQDSIAIEIRQLRADMNKAMTAIAINTGKSAEVLDNVSGGGAAFLTEAA